MNMQKCPACGAAVEPMALCCPVCGLEAPVRRFVNAAAQAAWVREVLEPHKAGLVQVFAGRDHGLILTRQGLLYGIGSNRSGQIREQGPDRFDQPQRMAEEVISAAAGGNYSIYVTRDGKVHLQGRGELADRFPGFGDAEEVYADQGDSFWIRTREGALLGFGGNKFQPRTHHVWKTMGPQRYLVHKGDYSWYQSGHPMEPYPRHFGQKHFEDWENSPREIELAVQQSEWYRSAVEYHGGDNVSVELGSHLSEQIPAKRAEPLPGASYRYGYLYNGILKKYTDAKRYTCFPKIVITNQVLYKPVFCTDFLWIHGTPHRRGSRPVMAPEWARQGSIRKLAGNDRQWLCLQQDGSVHTQEGQRLAWLDQRVYDLGLGNRFFILACQGGRFLWGDDPYCDQPEAVKKDNLRCFHLTDGV